MGQPVKVRESLRDATLDARLLAHPMQARISETGERLRELARALPGMRGRDRGLGHRDKSILAKEVRKRELSTVSTRRRSLQNQNTLLRMSCSCEPCA